MIPWWEWFSNGFVPRVFFFLSFLQLKQSSKSVCVRKIKKNREPTPSRSYVLHSVTCTFDVGSICLSSFFPADVLTRTCHYSVQDTHPSYNSNGDYSPVIILYSFLIGFQSGTSLPFFRFIFLSCSARLHLFRSLIHLL